MFENAVFIFSEIIVLSHRYDFHTMDTFSKTIMVRISIEN